MPWLAVRLSCSRPLPASTSTTVIALPMKSENTLTTSSLVVRGATTLIAGASLTAVIAMLRVPVLLFTLPSLTTKLTVRSVVFGLSEPLM